MLIVARRDRPAERHRLPPTTRYNAPKPPPRLRSSSKRQSRSGANRCGRRRLIVQADPSSSHSPEISCAMRAGTYGALDLFASMRRAQVAHRLQPRPWRRRPSATPRMAAYRPRDVPMRLSRATRSNRDHLDVTAMTKGIFPTEPTRHASLRRNTLSIAVPGRPLILTLTVSGRRFPRVHAGQALVRNGARSYAAVDVRVHK